MIIEALESGKVEVGATAGPRDHEGAVRGLRQPERRHRAALARAARGALGRHARLLRPQRPASPMAWSFLFDIVHHRGQITTYLRPMGSTVPQVYGPSADEP